MRSDNTVLRAIYIDPDIDDCLRDEALRTKTPKAELFRRYLSIGMGAVNADSNLLKLGALSNKLPLVLRSVHMDSDLDHTLRVEAFDRRVSKNDLIRCYARIGMDYKPPTVTVIAPTPEARPVSPKKSKIGSK